MEIERKFMRHLINTTPSGTSATYEVLGKDLEELNVELNAEVETKKNILGESNTKVSSYEAQAEVEPYYADAGSTLHTYLQDLIDNRKVLDELKTDVVEVHLWDEIESSGTGTGTYTAFKEEVIVEVNSYGGDNTGYQIPFTLHFTGIRTAGTFNPSTKTFTPAVSVGDGDGN